MIRVLFFGMMGRFSLSPLEKLLAAGVDIEAVVVPAGQPRATDLPRLLEPPRRAAPDLPMLQPYLQQTIVHLAWERQIPVWEIDGLSKPVTRGMLAALQPDLISVVCFPHIFPSALLALPRYGCLNLHPSLLPAYRGPAPLFWIARQDERAGGVTLHFLDRGVDSGDIVAQTGFERADGLSEAELEQRCAVEGATLLLEAVQQLEAGRPLPRSPQPEVGASYFPWPGEADYLVPTDWPARRAFNFLQGAAAWPLRIKAETAEFLVRNAISYSPDQKLAQPFLLFGDEAWFQFQPGVLRARVYL